MSTHEERDAETDRLLRAVLKPSSPDGAGACPDAGLLAAFVEGGLAATEQSALDTHIAACGRCQEALAVLAHDETDTGEKPVAEPESGWFTWVTRPRLRWLVPISAAATLAVVFLATRPLIAPEPSGRPVEVTQMAQAPATPAEVTGFEADALRERSAEVPEKREAAGAVGRVGSVVGAPKVPKAAPDAVPAAPPAGQRAKDKQAAEPAAGLMATRIASEERPAPAAAPPAPAPPPPIAAGQPAVAQQAVNVPAAADAVRKQAAAESQVAMPVGAARNLAGGLQTVSAPGGSVAWRFGAGGRLSRSGDAGMTWHEVRSGVSADLLAGAAPAPATCWIVGTAGTVLLTTDGERWERRPFPEAIDLVAVSASGSRAAVVTARDGRQFETLDGGRTWFLKQ